MYSDSPVYGMENVPLTGFNIFIISFLALSFLFAFYRLMRGPHIVDRIIAFDLLTAIFMGSIVFRAIIAGNDVYLDICLVMAIIIFLGTVAFARFIEMRSRTPGRHKEVCLRTEQPSGEHTHD